MLTRGSVVRVSAVQPEGLLLIMQADLPLSVVYQWLMGGSNHGMEVKERMEEK